MIDNLPHGKEFISITTKDILFIWVWVIIFCINLFYVFGGFSKL